MVAKNLQTSKLETETFFFSVFHSYLRLLCRLPLTVRNWPVYFLNRFGRIQGSVRYRLWNGMTILSRPHAIDGSALNEVWFDRSYDPNAFGIPFDWKSAKHIIDAGGHIGTFTLFAASKSPAANIVTLEPDPENFILLTTNVTLNKLFHRVTLHNVGLGDGKTITLHTFPHDRGGNSVYREGGIPVEIDTVSLADLFTQHNIEAIDYLKLDCEGAEYEALYTLPSQYFPRIRMIGMEYHHFSKDPRHNSETLQKHLEANGFTVVRHKKSMMIAYRT
jgi:FkbM family methyltransferase